MERPMSQPFDASRSLTALEQDSTIIAAIEIAQSKWLVAAVIPGIKRQLLKKPDADEASPSKLLHRWRKEADRAGHPIIFFHRKRKRRSAKRAADHCVRAERRRDCSYRSDSGLGAASK
jgi:transposase